MPHRLIALAKRWLRCLLSKAQPSVAIAVHPFDRAHGTDTSGLLEPQHLRTGHANDAQNTAYFGVPPSRFAHAVAQWQVTEDTAPAQEYRFIDLGCGKGRAVLLASRMGFQDVVGVELNPALAETANRNLRHWQADGGTAPTSVLCADAPTALGELLQGPTLLYLYNPFQAAVLEQVLAVVVNHAGSFQGHIDVLYLYPEYETVFARFPAFQRLWHRQIPLAGEDAGDGISAAEDPCALYRLQPGA